MGIEGEGEARGAGLKMYNVVCAMLLLIDS